MIANLIREELKRQKWRKINYHNGTFYRKVYGNMDQIHIGRYTYGGIYVSSDNPDHELVIGDFCSIAGDVKFLLGADHPLDQISTYPFKVKVLGTGIDAQSRGNIVVDDDVWIGEGVIVLSGVHIGQGAVVAAGAVVTQDVPPYTIAGGVPAHAIRDRFGDDVKEYLLSRDYKALTEEMIRDHMDELYMKINEQTSLDELRKRYDWFPKKQLKTEA